MNRFWIAVALATLPCLAHANDLSDESWVDRTFRVTGGWRGDVFYAESVQLRESYDDDQRGQVTGRVRRTDYRARTFKIGAVHVRWDAKTRFERMTSKQLYDDRMVRVTGEMDDDTLIAKSIRPAEDDGSTQITAIATSAQRRKDGAIELTMLDYPVVTTRTGYNGVTSLIRRQDSRRPAPQSFGPGSGRRWFFSSELDLELRDRNNYDLDDEGDTFLDSSLSLDLEALYSPTSRLHFFASISGTAAKDLMRDGGTDAAEVALERDQMWMFADRIFGTGFGLQVGRQNFRETREWWWDDDLDAIRLYYDRGAVHAEVGVAQEVARVSSLEDQIDPEQEDVQRVLGLASWMWAPRQKVELYFLRANDQSVVGAIGDTLAEDLEDESDASLTWYGLRAIGSRRFGDWGSVSYWADWATVSGRETTLDFDTVDDLSTITDVTRRDVRGSAFDLGATWETELPLSPSLTVGYARGDGDADPDDSVDESFRQTGLHNNKWRYAGVNRFRTYGEVLRPELSNLAISTVSVGVPFLRNSSVELAWHGFKQVTAADSMRDSRLDVDPTGLNRDIGQELDLIIGVREGRSIDFALTLGVFKPGDAFPVDQRETAYIGALEFTINL